MKSSPDDFGKISATRLAQHMATYVQAVNARYNFTEPLSQKMHNLQKLLQNRVSDK